MRIGAEKDRMAIKNEEFLRQRLKDGKQAQKAN